MKSNSKIKIKTCIKIVYMLFIGISLVYATAWGQENSGFPIVQTPETKIIDKRMKECDKLEKTNPSAYEKCLKDVEKAAREFRKDPQERCEKLADEIDKGLEAQMKACGDISNGKNRNCASKLRNCGGSANSDVGAITQVAQAMGAPRAQSTNCFDSPKDYFETRKEIEADIKSLSSDISKAEKELVKAEKEQTELIEKLHEAMIKEEEEFEKTKDESIDKNMEEERNALDEDQKAAGKMTNLQRKKMDLRSQLNTANLKAQAELIQANNQIAQSDCMRQVIKYKNEINESQKKLKKHGASGDMIGASNSMKKELEKRFDACMQVNDLKREAIAKELKDKSDSIVFDLNSIDEEMNRLQDYMKQSEQQRQQRIQKMSDKQQKALQKAAKKTQMLQSKLNDSTKQHHATIASIRGEIQNHAQQKAILVNRLNALGTIGDADRSGDKSIRTLVIEANAAKSKVAEYRRAGCCDSGSDDSKQINSRCKDYENYEKTNSPVPTRPSGGDR